MKHRKQHKFVFSLIAGLMLAVAVLTVPAPLFPETGKMTLVALGDCIISRKISVEQNPGFLELVKLIRDADCTWANCELPIVDIDKAFPEYREHDLPGAAAPWCADELKWLGVDIMGFSNNHTMDFGREGLFSTLENLDRVGIAYAGAGKDLEYASRPGYADTPGGRVGQVSCASAIHPGTHASLPTPFVRGRPGLNPMRIEDTVYLDKESYEAFKKISENIRGLFKEDLEKDDKLAALQKEKTEKTEKTEQQEPGQEESKKESKETKEKPVEKIYMYYTTFYPGEKTAYSFTLNQGDLERIIASVKIARRNARVVLVSMHAHQGSYKSDAPAAFLETFARACIDAGADAVFNTGPHRLWAIEIYKNKPIFYSLGNFFFQLFTEDSFPSETLAMLGLDHNTRDASVAMEKVGQIYFKEDRYWQGIMPRITFEKDNEITSIELYPISLRKGRPTHEQGTPFLADKEEGKSIIDELNTLSEPYKTKIENRNGVGVIRLK